MNKKKLTVILIAVVVLTVGAVAVFFNGAKLTQTMNVCGYEISIPKNWSYDSKGGIYDKKGHKAGSFVLVDNPDIRQQPNGEGVKISENITKYADFLLDSTPAVLYYAENLENPEPHGAQMIFFDEYVSERLADKIVNTFKAAELGENPPPKKIEAPDLDNSVIRIDFEDKSVSVKNSGFINAFAEELELKESSGINIVSYKEADGKREIASWKYIESSRGKGYMYTYDNNPIIFSSLSKVISEENEVTAYYLKLEEKEDIKLIDFPLNRVRDNAKELIALKTSNAKSADIQNILDKILGKDELNKLSFTLEGNTLSITFAEGVESDRAKAYSHSAVIFSIAENVENIKVSYADGKSFTFTREQINKAVSEEIGSVADNEKTFVDYTEKIEETVVNQADGQVVYSGTVVISYNTMVTHPRTGERVAIGPYAEERGYGGYLGRPISCVIRRSGSGYIATASCGGSVLASYPLENEARLQWAIGMINSYS